MRREDLEHVIRAAAEITKDEIVIVGSQAILAQFPDAPEGLLRSMEADVYPRSDPGLADDIDGAIGDGSRFHETYGYYAHGVGPETPVAPAGWENRLVRIDTAPTRPKDGVATGWCLEIHDLVLAKLAAGRPKDMEFAAETIRHGLVDLDQLRLSVDLMAEKHRQITGERLDVAIRRATTLG